MSRKRCCGKIFDLPRCERFIPEESDPVNEQVVLYLEEMEAIRLKDLENLDQITCAQIMELSRPTFQRILSSGRKKVATALMRGQTIIIKGGNYIMQRTFECKQCKHVWTEPPCTEGGKHGYEIPCPKCGSLEKVKLENGERHACNGGHHHGGGGCCCGHH
ncbi:MAG: DUF134 domain-containing protein [bacterium]